MVKKTKSILRFPTTTSRTASPGRRRRATSSRVDGRWELSELDANRTKAVYALDIDPGRMLGMLLRGPVEGQVKTYLTKGAAEGLKSTSRAARLNRTDRCAPLSRVNPAQLPRYALGRPGMAKLAESTADLKSAARKGACGFESRPGH